MEQTKQKKQEGSQNEQLSQFKEHIGHAIRKSSLKWAPAFRMTILLIIFTIAVLIRVFSVIRYESIIHEFDPWFNYRTTQYMVQNDEGLYGLWNWFDSESWYPLGRSVGGTVYPGLHTTAAIIYWSFHRLSIPIDIRNVCVFLAPIFAALTALASYLITKEITKRSEAGLFAALFISIVPSYMSRSVAGSYDNEAVAIFALVFTFYLWVKAVNTGSILWSSFAGLALFYMVASWGGYAFIVNIVPIFVIFLLITGRYKTQVYVAYCVFYLLGTLLAMQIPFVGFQAIHSSEHMASHGVFILLQVYTAINFIRQYITQKGFALISKFFIGSIIVVLLLGFFYLFITGKTKWSGRSMTLLDPTYAKKYIPIIASVSEHQATTWSSFFFDLHFLVIFTPVGIYYCFKNPNYGKIFAGMYVVLSVYFASVMVRLLLVLAPAVSIVGAIGVSYLFRLFTKSIRISLLGEEKPRKTGQEKKVRISPEIAVIGLILMSWLVSTYILHANFTGAEAYSSPSIILSNRDRFGNRHIIDDFREAYYWLRMNSRPDDKIMSWWDYGYQITGMSNRTVLVDNNTWNNTHIATVGLAMSSPEDDAFEICERLDVDYVLVIFGGLSYYSGDDINKFLWMVRIASGVYPHIKEEDYYGNGQYRVDQQATETMKNSLMYRLSFYRFDEMQTAYGKPKGYDTVRQTDIGLKGFKLEYFEEAFTSENWIVRIYRKKPRHNREGLRYTSKTIASYPTNVEEFIQSSELLQNYRFRNKVLAKKKRKLATDTYDK